ncbi:winged helix-turn-helix domain-containing protein [Mesorhizobium sp. Z1-4]|uniref:winged helix-turn-helix domain-containing protein n=1 Tax=Mesorhizobium sp. Z1-4 TaxID=2448478 RepID=UPI00197DD668|nr:winged helix-turn-helix domain-containing protein [Mesorhizobium sp. Z1-4]
MSCSCPTCGQALPFYDELQVDPAGIVVRRGRFARLSGHEFTIFETLRAAAGRLVTREALMAVIYPLEQDEAQIRIIDVWICKLRKKVKPLGVEIGTAWGRGYRLISKAPEQEAA